MLNFISWRLFYISHIPVKLKIRLCRVTVNLKNKTKKPRRAGFLNKTGKKILVHSTHATHTRVRHRGFFFFFDIGKDTLSGEQHAGD